MIEALQNLNYILSLAGIGAILGIGILIFDLKTTRSLASLVSTWGFQLVLLVSSASTVLTLVYSEYFGLIPCGLCWLERIALYPQVLLIAVSLYYKDTLMPRYGIALSIFGLIVSLYHHYLQMGGSEFIKCPVSGEGAECAKRFFFEFNFMTFPLMSAILFAFLITLYVYMLRVRTNQ
jgi:disulfide bond formation protein DsbB